MYENPPSENKVRKALKFDPLAKAEEITGKSYKEDKTTESLGVALHFLGSKAKEQMLQASGDSYFNMEYAKFLKLALEMGFSEVLSDTFVGNDEKKETFKLLWNPSGLLLKAESFSWPDCMHVNSSDIYFNWEPNSKVSNPDIGYSGGYEKNGEKLILVGHFDTREGMKTNLKCLLEDGRLVVPWFKSPSLFLLTYGEQKSLPEDWKFRRKLYDEVNALRVERLPAYVRCGMGLE
jgi:hypothetical protein